MLNRGAAEIMANASSSANSGASVGTSTMAGAAGKDGLSEEATTHAKNGSGSDIVATDTSNGRHRTESGTHSNGVRPHIEAGSVEEDIIRLISQHLKIIGLERSAEAVLQESGCRFEHGSAVRFRKHVLAGEWLQADVAIKELYALIKDDDAASDVNLNEMRFLLLEQKYLEYLEEDRALEALSVLRNELTPLAYNTARVHQLSSYVMMRKEWQQRASWTGKGLHTRTVLMDRVQAFLPPTIMLPPRRLRVLLNQAVEEQAVRCSFHDMSKRMTVDKVSLLQDHRCSEFGLPMQELHVLNNHSDEVWYCKFSPDGYKLATGSKDMQVLIWDVDPDTLAVKCNRSLEGHTCGASFIAWGPDSTHLIVCGPEDCADLWIWCLDEERVKLRVCQATDDSLTCVAFNGDGTRFVAGGIKGQFYMFGIDGTVLDQWDGIRVNSLHFMSDNKTVLAADTHNRIRAYVFDNPRSEYEIVQEKHPIMSFIVNSMERLVLLNLATQGVNLWDLQEKVLLRRFHGPTQGTYTIYSAFGGINENFIASGSEDNKIYMWHDRHEKPLWQLTGHTRTVNCVTWNPVFPALLASASDDGTVRIWGPGGQSSDEVISNVSDKLPHKR